MEEVEWLVTRSDSESSRTFGTMTYNDDRLTGTGGAGEPDNTVNMAASAPDAPPDNESGELLDVGDSSALDNFHEDAIAQAGCGMSQVRVVLASSLAVGAASLELASVPFILPSAEIELCILPHEKNWLVLISLVGCALGSSSWGALAPRLGRRRALMSALAVNAVFAAVAAAMPTYGTFMMARFCSAIGSGGIVPCCFAYTAEMTSRACRHRALAVLLAGAGAGALVSAALADAILPQTGVLTLIEDKEHFSAWHRALAVLLAGAGAGALVSAALADAILPQTGVLTIIEDKEHFSAWHRYLLLCILPILGALVLLIWTHESPRFLLDVGREVDAMTTYQSIHSGNQTRLCGKAAVAGTNSRPPAYHLAELALPGKRRHATHARSGALMLWVSIFQLFSSAYRRTTLCLGGILLLTMAIQIYLSSYVPGTVVHASSQEFEASKKTIQNVSLYNEHRNTTIENVHYYNVSFTNCTFRDMLISHATFKNCSFYDVAFFNIKTSYTMFEGCLLVNSTMIDTDIEVGRELDSWCVLNGTTLRGLRASCARRADLTSRLQPRIREQTYVSHAMLIAAVLALLPQKLRPMVVVCGLCALLSPLVYWARWEAALYGVEAAYRAALTLAFFNVATAVVDHYPPHHRCTAHGLMLTVAYSGCALVGGLAGGGGGGGPALSAALCALLSAAATLLAYKGR